MFNYLDTKTHALFAAIAKPFIFIFLFLCSFHLNASHFRAGTISWRETSLNVVKFDIVQSWRWSAFGNPALGTITPISSMTYGDGTSTAYSLLVTAINSAEDYFVGTVTLTKTYPTAGTYIMQYSDCCRVGGIQQGNSGLSMINRVTVKTGTLNQSPTVNSLPIIPFQINVLNTVTLPVSDADGNPISFSVTPVSSSGLNTAIPSGLNLSSNGVITWTPTIAGLYAFNVTISDGIGTSVVDLMLNVTANCTTCNNNPPNFQPTAPPTFYVTPGVPFQTTITAIDPDGNTPSIFSGGLPAGATLSPNINPSTNIATRTFNWTPPINASDAFVCFTTTDGLPNGQYIGQYCMSLIMQNAPVFNSPPTPLDGTAFCVITGETFSTTIEAQLASGENVYISSLTGLPGATASPTLPTTPTAVASTVISWSPSPADWGLHTATVTATSASGLSTTLSYNFTVNSTPVITSLPTLSVSPNNTYTYTLIATDANIPYGDELEISGHGLPSWLTLVDNGDGTATLSGTPTCGDVNEYEIEIRVEDIWHHCGPHVEQSFTLTVANTTPPVLNCPASLTVNTDANSCSAVVNYAAIATSNCGDVTLEYSVASGSAFIKGTTNVVVTAEDEEGNISSCNFNVVVADAEAPSLTCPSDIEVSHDSGECGALVSFAVTASDNCGNVTLEQTSGLSSGSNYPLGLTTNTFVATDLNGLETECTFTVNVTGDADDDDCDGVQNACDVCPGGDDSVDANNDGTPDCSQLLAYEAYGAAWKCAPNKIKICHNGNTICINKNALPAHYNHGDNVGPCTSCETENRVVKLDDEINFEVIGNPVSDQLQLVIIGHSNDDIFLNIYNNFGNFLMTKHVDFHAHDVNIDLSSSNMVSGQYLVQMVAGNTTLVKKFVILK